MPEHEEPSNRDEEAGWAMQYKKLELLGDGGYAEVFEAVEYGGRHVALKISKRGDEQLRRFTREVEVLADLKHRNVVELLNAGPDWYVMPLADGSLTKLAAELSDEERVELVEHVAAGLNAAHAKGLIHRDVSPNNILRTKDGKEVCWSISDFGLVRRPPGQSSVPVTHGPVGTFGFWAPEVTILGGHNADQRADIYSLGRTIEFMTTAKWPVGEEAIKVPEIWRPLVGKMTCRSVEERFQRMSDVLAALPAVRSRLKAERRANFVAVPILPRDELRPQELMVLRSILWVSTDTFTEEQLRNATRKTYNPRILAMGLLGLRDRGFLADVINDHGEKWGERLSPAGTRWVLDHHQAVDSGQPEPEPEPEQPEPEPEPPASKDDAPF